jgi:hypothetical protein
MIALSQVEIGGDIVQRTFLILLGGVVFALALAFGLGGRNWAAAMLQRWWPQPRQDEELSPDELRSTQSAREALERRSQRRP